ncbi:hypothetical protein [Frateuria sp.]|uniref:hypothetical protein n=1 Tax=Frateuria sp. TaxID=2211372 RepID=UPI003F81CB2F
MPTLRILPRLALGLCLALPLAAAFGATPAVHLQARAYADDGRLLYRESHWVFATPEGRTRLVLYRCPDGEPFARKWVRDHGQPTSPDFELEDARRGYREGVRRRADGRREVFVRRDTGSAGRSALLDDAPAPVIDAGFDAFLRAHWNLAPDASLGVPFLLPSRLGTLDFKVRRLPDQVIDGRPERRFRLGLDSLIGFALPHLDVAYDARSRALRRFRGIANIRDVEGRNLSVRIDFAPPEPIDNASATVQDAARQPLTGRCPLR